MKPNPAAPTARVSLGGGIPAPAFAVDDVPAAPEGFELGGAEDEDEDEDESATCVTMVVVCGGTVVPGIVVAATVDTGFALTPLGRLCVTVVAAIVLGGFVVPGIVVVYVTSCPSEFDGIAPPTPVPVNCVGTDRVAVLGFDAGAAPYMLPEAPLARVKSPERRFAWEPSGEV